MRSVKPGIMACRSPRFSVVKYSTVHPLFSAKVRKMLAHFLVLDRGGIVKSTIWLLSKLSGIFE